MPNYMAQHGAALIANGWPILPIMPGSKVPGQYSRGEWRPYTGWSKHCTRATTEYELDVWREWPDCGVGIACGQIVGIDIDVLDPAIADEVASLAYEMLGETAFTRIGLAPKRMLVYRTETPFQGPREQPLEVLGTGRQFVAYATHPATGRPYAWTGDEPAHWSAADLPVVTEEMCRHWLTACYMQTSTLRKSISIREKAAARHHGSIYGQPGTYEAVAAAVAYIPNNDVDYDSWLQVGMAIKGAIPESGGELFARWSAQSQKDDPQTTWRTWQSLKPHTSGAGTIYWIAQEYGWVPPFDLELHPAGAPVTFGDDGDLAPDPAPPTPREPPAPDLFPLPMPDGLVGDMVAHIVSTAVRPQPVLALGAVLAGLGAIMGGKFASVKDLRTNLYIIGIADSGSGKAHARTAMQALFYDAGLAHYLGGHKIASGAGLLTALHRQPNLLLQIDEFGMFLAGVADKRKAPRHLTEIVDNLTELYTSTNITFLGAEYANRDGKNARRDIDQPCLCLYGTTAPQHFWAALQSASVVDGSLARFLVLHTDEDFPDAELEPSPTQWPTHIIDACKAIAAVQGTGGDIGRVPHRVPMDGAAKAAFRSLSDRLTLELRARKGTHATSILARIAEHTIKVALILAVATNPQAPCVTEAQAQWAITFAEYSARRLLRDIERHVADNDQERASKRVMTLIRDAGADGISKSDLTRRTQWLDKRAREQLLASLIEAGQITTVSRPGDRRNLTVLVAVE